MVFYHVTSNAGCQCYRVDPKNRSLNAWKIEHDFAGSIPAKAEKCLPSRLPKPDGVTVWTDPTDYESDRFSVSSTAKKLRENRPPSRA